jgi:RNA polymerase sigma factor (sigma-70 family)
MEHLNLIRKIAWSFHNSTGLEWDDLFSEACLAYYEGLSHYDPSRGKITTFMYYWIPNHLINYIKRNRKHQSPLISLEEINVDRPVIFNLLFESFSIEAQQIAEVITSSPQKYVGLSKSSAKNRVRQVMERRGWTWERIADAFHDLRMALS